MSGMLLFIIVVIVLIVWVNNRSGARQRPDSEYQRGLTEGYREAIRQLRSARRAKGSNLETIDEFLTEAERQLQPQPEQPQQAGLVEPAPIPVNSAPVMTHAAQPVEVSYVSETVLSPEEIEHQKTRQTIRNLNTILYVASFLIVAATALFVTLTMPAIVKLLGLIGVTVLFYVVGLVLHASSTRLRSAAVAFVGTGLAIVPFIGFALTMLGNLSNESAWLITSLFGLAAYGVAAVRLQSQLVSYITMAFIVSLALSAVSMLGLAIMWYFIVVIGASLLFNCVIILAPKRLPEVFTRPLRDTGLVTTPIALVASLLSVQSMSLWMYIVLFAVSTAHYMVVWLIQRTVVYELTVRVLAHLTALLVVVEVIKDMVPRDGIVWFGLSWLVLAVLQVVYSLVRLRRDQPASVRRETVCLAISVGLLSLVLPLWAGTDALYHWMSLNLALIGLVCASIAYRLRQVEWLYGSLVVSVLLLLTICRGMIQPGLSFEIIAAVATSIGLVCLVGLERAIAGKRPANVRLLLGVAVGVFASVVAMCGVIEMSSTALGWTMAVAAGMLIALSYLTRQPGLEVIGAILGVVSIAAWIDVLPMRTEWQLLVTVVVSSIALAVGAVVHQYYRQSERRDYLTVFGAIVFAGLILVAIDGGELVLRTATLLLLVGGAGALLARGLLADIQGTLKSVAMVTYVLYPAIALILGVMLGGGWLALAMLVMTGVMWIGSYIEKQPAMTVVGHILLVVTLAIAWSWLAFSSLWMVHGVLWISAAVYGLMYWQAYDRSDDQRFAISLGSMLAVLVTASLYGLFVSSSQLDLASAGSLLMVATVLAVHGYLYKLTTYFEAAAYVATLGLQWVVSVLLPEVGSIVFAHWWAIVVFLVAMWQKDYKTRLIIALGLVTASTGFYALTGPEGYALFFLAEHLSIAIVGAVLRKQWAMWWGVIAVVLAVLYFLRGYTFLALLFLGFLLILFVIWRLLRMGKKSS